MTNSSVTDLEKILTAKYGPMIGGADLIKCLGFRTQAGFKRSQRLGLLRIHVFEIPNRRGNFALSKDVAKWIHQVSRKDEQDDLVA